jgi:GT2 family glycosyltransferase
MNSVESRSTPPEAAVVVPTRDRPAYLEVALASIVPQARAAGADVLVVDDGPSDVTRAITEAAGARYVSHDSSRGLNAARNTGLDATDAQLVAFVDDDVDVHAGWLDALLEAAGSHADVEVFAGPIHARIEDHPLRMCGREGPPITSLELGPDDTDARYAWGANMTIRRSAIERIGPFDPGRGLYGDEQEWQDRLREAGGRILYVARAALDHRRAGDDARLTSLGRAAYARGRALRRFDASQRRAPSLAAELRTFAGCLMHTARYRCTNGLVLAAHSAGRVSAAIATPPPPPAVEGENDFLSGESGTVGGRHALLRRARDRWLDARDVLSGRRLRLVRAARAEPPPRRVLVLGVSRPEHTRVMDAVRGELASSRHDVDIILTTPGASGKFENLNQLLAETPLDGYDWLLVVDDDVELPQSFLNVFLFLAERFELRLAQPAHRLSSHAAWSVTRRRPGTVARETGLVEIGPVTAFHKDTFAELLPFPPVRMGWGLDVHWAAVARSRGWRIGVIDAVPVAHRRPAAAAYSSEAAIAEARAFLADRPYVPRREAQRTLAAHRGW